MYLEIEQAAINPRHLTDPGDVSWSLQEVVNDIVATWRIVDRRRSERGHV